VDNPKGRLYGSQTAAPCAKEIMQEVLLYMDVQPQYTDAEKKAIASNQAVVPDLTGQSIDNAIGILAGKGLSYAISPNVDIFEELTVIDQYPKAGEKVNKESVVTLYYN
jgi:stage V sporulation protein D (sporulation-specific penicillin-binding protein)